MTARLFFSICAIPIILFPSAAGQMYNTSGLNSDLKTDANAIIRLVDQTLEKQNNDKVVLTVTKAITVLNENGKKAAYLYLPYDKFIHYKDIDGTIYDSEGKKERRIRADEIHDFSNIASYSLYEDNRIKFIRPETNDFPYTVEYTYEMVLNGFIQYPAMPILPAYNISLEKGIYRIIMPEDEEFRYKTMNLKKEPEISREGEMEIYTWDLKNIPAIKEEPFTANIVDLLPVIYIKPGAFSYGGKSGSLESWETFGKWIWDLMEDKDQLDEAARQEILDLIKNCNSDSEKTKVLYKYMQDKVRYVNLSLGLGGLEPIPAEQVHEVSYGDCKALSNYMRSVLKVAGIESVYTLVSAGENPRIFMDDFPSSQFNHVILMVPVENDSIWLECTSQRLPANFLGDFTDDRKVLFITKNGGFVGKTPAFTLEENSIHTRIIIKIDKEFDASIERTRSFNGTFFDNEYSNYLGNDATARKRRILNQLKLSEFSLDSINHTIFTDEKPVMTERICISDNKFLPLTDEYVSLGLNSVSELTEIPKRIRNRQFNYYSRRDILKTDTVQIILPENVSIISTPEHSSIDTEFGRYSSKIDINGHTILYTRRIELYKADLPPEKYADFYDFCRGMNTADNRMILLKHNPE